MGSEKDQQYWGCCGLLQTDLKCSHCTNTISLSLSGIKELGWGVIEHPYIIHDEKVYSVICPSCVEKHGLSRAKIIDNEVLHLKELEELAELERLENKRKDKHNQEHPESIQATSIKALIAYADFTWGFYKTIIYE